MRLVPSTHYTHCIGEDGEMCVLLTVTVMIDIKHHQTLRLLLHSVTVQPMRSRSLDRARSNLGWKAGNPMGIDLSGGAILKWRYPQINRILN